jgi:hypothetical protein
MNNQNQTESLPATIGSEPLSKLSHELYAHERSFGTAITIAAERAGLGRRSGVGSKLEANPDVKARIAYLAGQEKAVLDEKRKRLEQRQWLWHDWDISQFYDQIEEPFLDESGNFAKDENGKLLTRTHQRLKPFSEIPQELRMCIESLTYTESGRPVLKLYSKADANKELRKINGIDKAPSNDDGDPAMRLPDNEFFKELAKQADELGVDIKMTFEISPNE